VSKLPTNNLPRGIDCFIGREDIFEQLRKGFENSNTLSISQTIKGMGGLGKTQTAIEYARRYASKYNLIWWVVAETKIVIEEYKQFAIKMGLLDESEKNEKKIKETVLEWMNSNSGWLFIYDNVEYIEEIKDILPPKKNNGNVIITTRNIQLDYDEIDINIFSKEEAVEFLEERTKIQGSSEDALKIAERLGYLPLALEQAAAYIKINKIPFDEYLSLFDDNTVISLLEENERVRNATITIAETMDKSIKKLDPNSAAIQLLYLCSYMAAEGIDESLFNKHPELLPSPLKEVVNKKETWQKLTNYSLLKKQVNEKGEASFNMHRLLQEVVRNKINENQEWALCCLDIFYETYDLEYGNVASHNNFMKLTPHVEAFLNASESYLMEDKQQDRLGLLYNMGGIGLGDLGYYNHALEWHQKGLEIYKKVLGEEHPDTATAYNNVAYIYDMLKDYNNALEMYQKTLVIHEKIYDAEDLSIATSYNNIASVYDELGDFNKALEFYHMSMIIREKELGLEHPDVALVYDNIGLVYCTQGDYIKSFEYHNKAKLIREKKLGIEHPHVSISYNNIGCLYSKQKDKNAALEWFHKSLNISEKILGVEHPDTATTYNNLAVVYDNQGKYDEALKWYFKALDIRKKILGKTHPSTATTYNNIAIVCDNQGKYDEALKWYTKALTIYEKVLGETNPLTTNTYINRARVYYHQEKYGKALKLLEAAVVIYEKVFGATHTDTIAIYNIIADVYARQGKHSKTMEWRKKALAVKEKVP